MQANNSTEQTDAPLFLNTPESKAQLSVYILTFLLGSVGNILVLLVIRGKRHRTINDLFIVNLAVSDLLMIGFLPLYTVKILVGLRHSTLLCKSVPPVVTMTFFVSVFTLTSMAVHRCYVITNPYKPEMQKYRVLVWLLGVWLASFLVVLPLVLVSAGGTAMTDCQEDWPSDSARKAYTACLFTMQFSLPLTIITVAYIRIAVDLLRSKIQRFGGGSNNNRREGAVPLRHAHKEDIQVLKTVAVIVVVFAVCLLPVQLAWMLMDFGGEREKRIAVEVFFKFDILLSTLHSCLNPLVYGTLTRRFRRGYIRYLVYLCPCIKKRVPAESIPGSLYVSCRASGKKPNGPFSYSSHEESTQLRGASPDTRTTYI